MIERQKKLTLQEYLECHNIKKNLQSRSKQKSKSKQHKKKKEQSNRILPDDLSKDDSRQYSQNHQNNTKLQNLTKQQLNTTIFGEIDFRAKNLYLQLQQSITQIKLECRSIIRNDKDFAFFIRLIDNLMRKFKEGLMHIHRQNLILFQISNQNDKTVDKQRDQLFRTHLQKTFDDRWVQSKNLYEQSSAFLPNKTIKQGIEEKKKGQQLVRAIFGGGNIKQTKLRPKVHLQQPRTEQQRQQRKQEAVSFLALIMSNISEIKQNKQPQKAKSADKPTKIQSKKDKIKDRKDKKVDFLGEQIANQIKLLNSSGKIDIDTDQIDKYYEQHNVSFGTYAQQSQPKVIERFRQKSKQAINPIPKDHKSPRPNNLKVSLQRKNKIIQTPMFRRKSPDMPKYNEKNPEVYQQILQRKNSKSNGKLVRGLQQKKVFK